MPALVLLALTPLGLLAGAQHGIRAGSAGRDGLDAPGSGGAGGQGSAGIVLSLPRGAGRRDAACEMLAAGSPVSPRCASLALALGYLGPRLLG